MLFEVVGGDVVLHLGEWSDLWVELFVYLFEVLVVDALEFYSTTESRHLEVYTDLRVHTHLVVFRTTLPQIIKKR